MKKHTTNMNKLHFMPSKCHFKRSLCITSSHHELLIVTIINNIGTCWYIMYIMFKQLHI